MALLVSFLRRCFIGLDGDDRLNRDPSGGDQLATRPPSRRREWRSPQVLPDEHPGSASRVHGSREVLDVFLCQELRQLSLDCLYVRIRMSITRMDYDSRSEAATSCEPCGGDQRDERNGKRGASDHDADDPPTTLPRGRVRVLREGLSAQDAGRPSPPPAAMQTRRPARGGSAMLSRAAWCARRVVRRSTAKRSASPRSA